jgi:quercetin dioxygenase-like cupin family protein
MRLRSGGRTNDRSKERGDERVEERSVGTGSVIFVEAGLEHRFFDIEEELVVLVVFAPEEVPTL